MKFQIGDLVTRKKYNNDTIFKIISIDNNMYFLKGINVRLCADSAEDDLQKYETNDTDSIIDDDSFFLAIRSFNNFDRNDYFYLPGKILHIDGDQDYLKRCLRFYKEADVKAMGLYLAENEISGRIKECLEQVNPDILVITGHDAILKKNDNIYDNTNYKNTNDYIEAVKEARKYEKSHEKLIIIAGACQSNYEELIKSGANFASSPKRVNIHALDPAIIATAIGLSDRNKDIDLIGILNKTKYGSNGRHYY